MSRLYYNFLVHLCLAAVLLETRDGRALRWSSRQLDRKQQDEGGDRVRVPLIKSREEDVNRDGLKDRLWLQLEMLMEPGEEVVNAQAVLLFDYQLHRWLYGHLDIALTDS